MLEFVACVNVQLGVLLASWLWFTCLVTKLPVEFSVHVIVRLLPSVSFAQNQHSGVEAIPVLWLAGVGVLIVGLLLVVNSNVSLTLL